MSRGNAWILNPIVHIVKPTQVRENRSAMVQTALGVEGVG